AEDGIRDATVTGVQTCALPIYCRRATLSTRGYGRERGVRTMKSRVRTMKSILSVALLSSLGLWATAVEAWDTEPPSNTQPPPSRSEERRVGKEAADGATPKPWR